MQKRKYGRISEFSREISKENYARFSKIIRIDFLIFFSKKIAVDFFEILCSNHNKQPVEYFLKKMSVGFSKDSLKSFVKEFLDIFLRTTKVLKISHITHMSHMSV